jgi:hypothetical protein
MKSQEAKLIPFMAEMFVEAYILRHYGEGNRLGQMKSRCLWEWKIAHTCGVIARDVSNKLAEAISSRMCRGVVKARVHEFKIKYKIFRLRKFTRYLYPIDRFFLLLSVGGL